MNRVLFLALLAAAVLVAGCTDNAGTGDGDGDGGTTTSPPQEITTAQAQSLLADAAQNMPDAFGMVVTVTKGGAEAVRMEGAVDNASGESYFEVTMDPTLFEDEATGGSGSDDFAAAFADGFSFYATNDGVVYILNGTAFTFPASEGEDSFVPSPEDSPFGEFLEPTEAFGEFDDNVTVNSVRPITHKGKAAYEIQATLHEDEEATNATVIVYRSPERLARIQADLPMEEGEDDPLAGGQATVEMLYEDEVGVEVPEEAKRAFGLRYDGGGFSFGGEDEPKTWTFQGSAGIPLSEVEAQVKDPAAMMGDDAGPDSLGSAPTLWSMKLSEGSKTMDGVTLTFTDADGDEKVSAGDTLVIEGAHEDGSPPQVVLYDTVTGTYVVPGAGLLLAGLALAAAALLLRRK